MAVSDMFKQAASAAGKGISQSLGNIEKAVIEIIDMRGRAVTVEQPVPTSGRSGLMPSLSGDGIFAGAEGLADAVKDAASNAASAFEGVGIGGTLSGATRKTFTVQFNPGDLTVSGYGGGMVAKTNYGDKQKAGSVSFEPADVRVSMNVKLVFDKVDPQDAFAADKFRLTASSVATGAAKAVQSALGKKDNSVQTEVEGFIAALRSPYTRRITFHWGKLNYSGTLNRVSAQYTMFNLLGQPIRAYVTLSLICADQTVSPASMGVWEDSYEEAFGGGSQSFTKAAQKVGSLVNFNL